MDALIERRCKAAMESVSAFNQGMPSFSYVYFLVAPMGKRTRLKIGVTQDHRIRKRLASIQGMSPVKCRLWFAVRGSAGLESQLHMIFRKSRLHGEWFELSPEIRAFGRLMKKYGPRYGCVVNPDGLDWNCDL